MSSTMARRTSNVSDSCDWAVTMPSSDTVSVNEPRAAGTARGPLTRGLVAVAAASGLTAVVPGSLLTAVIAAGCATVPESGAGCTSGGFRRGPQAVASVSTSPPNAVNALLLEQTTILRSPYQTLWAIL